MEKTNLEIRKNNRQENRRVDDIRTTSVTFDDLAITRRNGGATSLQNE